ncbi:MAG: GYF domain-containing protein [Verrucomicrobiota bacterium]
MNEWYYTIDGIQQGPVAFGKLRELAASGTLVKSALVWNQGMKDWRPAEQVEGLFSVPPVPADPANPQANAWAPAIPEFDEPALPEIEPGSERVGVSACFSRAFQLAARHFGILVLALLITFAISFAISIPFGIVEAFSQVNQPAPAPVPVPVTANQFWKAMEVGIRENFSAASIAHNIISNLVSLFLSAGIFRIGLNIVSGKQATVGQLFSGGPVFLKMLGAAILSWLCTLAAAIPSFIPWYFIYTRHLVPFMHSNFETPPENWQEIALLVTASLLLALPAWYLAIRLGWSQIAIVDRNLGVFEALRYSWNITRRNFWKLVGVGIVGMLIALAGVLLCFVGLLFAIPVVWLLGILAYRWMQYGHRAALDHPGTRRPQLHGTP